MTSPSAVPRPRGSGHDRPDIDGLRAIAVLAVILFHFEVPPFSGGFVGVDVFFVISGFLITRIIDAELRERRFSILNFYERRLRRIAPALLLVVLVSTGACLFTLLPGDLRPAGTSLVNAALFTSNMLFYSMANDYFAADNLSLTPVLHTWSLAVEAQFYLVYPWLLLGLGRKPGLTGPVLVLLAVLSFAGSAWLAFTAPSAAFYLLPWRAWELLLGAFLTLRRPDRQSRAASAAQGILGLALLAAAVLVFTRNTSFPGAAALLPCGGAALLIRAGTNAATPGLPTRLLSARLPVTVGRISYSLYLWHWPLLVFASYGRSGPLSAGERIALIGLAFALAAASWWLVERPFIARTALPGRRTLFAAAALGTAVVVGAGSAVEQAGKSGSGPAALPADVMTMAKGQYDAINGECRPENVRSATAPPCRFGAVGVPPTVVLWGNSYARMWTPTLDIDAAAQGAAGVSLLLSKCLPLLGVAFPDLPGCATFNEAAIGYIEAHPELHTVVLGANWFIAGPRLHELAKGLDALTKLGRRIVVLLAPPQPDFPVPRTLAIAALRHEPPPPPIDLARARDAQRDSLEVIEALRQTYGFTVIDPADRMCDETSCPLAVDNHPVFFDGGHLSITGARHAAGLFAPVFQP